MGLLAFLRVWVLNLHYILPGTWVLAEFVGGICVALGLLTRVFSIQLVIILAVATFYIHLPNGFLWIKGGYEYPLLWMLIMIAITFRGGGAFSLDSQLPKEF